MFCTTCGSQMDDAARFCPSCGATNVPEAAAGADQAATVVPGATPPQPPAAPSEPPGPVYTPNSPPPPSAQPASPPRAVYIPNPPSPPPPPAQPTYAAPPPPPPPQAPTPVEPPPYTAPTQQYTPPAQQGYPTPPPTQQFGAQPPYDPYAAYGTGGQQPAPRRSGMNPAVLAGIVVAVLIAGGLGAFFLLKGDDDKPADTNGGGGGGNASATTDNGGGGQSNAKWDTANADALAHTAVLAVEDLPGRGWTVDAEDEFDDGPTSFGEGPACEAISDKGNALDEATHKLRVGRAKRHFVNEPGGTVPVLLRAENQVEVYETTAKLANYVNDFDKILNDKDFPNCLATDTDPNWTGKKVTPFQSAPAGGKAYAWELTGKNRSGQQQTLRYDLYVWVLGNAYVTLSVYGDTKDAKSDVVKAILDKALTRSKDVQSGKLKPNGGGATKSPSPSRSPSPSPSVVRSPSPSPSVQRSPSPSPSPTPGGPRRDTFDDNKLGWPQGAYGAGSRVTGTRTIVGGKLRYEVTATQPFLTWDNVKLFHDGTQDLTMKVEVRKLSGPADTSYGLAFHIGANSTSAYFFLVRDDGLTAISIYDGSTTANIYLQGNDAAIAKPNQPQVLELTMRGSTITFKVNGTQIGQVTDARLKDGNQGVALSLPTQGTSAIVEFDNWEVSGATG